LKQLENDFGPPSLPTLPGRKIKETIPIILSSDFLEIYNVLHWGKGLPQLSEATATGIPILLPYQQ